MSDFFNNYFNINKIIKDKREYRQHVERIKALPEDYQYVYEKIQKYMWSLAAGDGYDMMKVQYDLISLFEGGAANGQHVLKITGDDVAAFADELLKNARTYTENWRDELNQEIKERFKKD